MSYTPISDGIAPAALDLVQKCKSFESDRAELLKIVERYLASAANPKNVDIVEVDRAARVLLARIKGES